MEVKVEGVARLINQLEKFSPEVSKALKKDMRKGADVVAAAARKRVPNDGLTNWGAWSSITDGRDLGFIGAWVKRGIKVDANRYRRAGVTTAFGYSVVSSTPAGNIFEVAGTGKRVSGRRGRGFVRNLNAAQGSGPLPRTLYPAYYEGIGQARALIEAAVREAERKVGR